MTGLPDPAAHDPVKVLRSSLGGFFPGVCLPPACVLECGSLVVNGTHHLLDQAIFAGTARSYNNTVGAVFAGMARSYNNTVGVDKSTVEEGSGRLPAALVKPAGEC